MYNYSIVFSMRDVIPVRFDTDFVTLFRNTDVVDRYSSFGETMDEALTKASKPYILYEYDSDISCREILIGRIQDDMDRYMLKIRSYIHPIVFIKATGIDAELAVNAISKFTNSGFTSINIVNVDDTVIIKYKVNFSRLRTEMWLVSFLLFIMRKSHLLKQISEKFSDAYYPLHSLLMFMCKEFLEHTDLGDAANHPVLLSMYCHIMSDKEFFTHTVASGPVTGVLYGSTTEQLIKYIKEVYRVKFPDNTTLTQMRNSVPGYFLNGFDTVLGLIKNQKEVE